MAAWLIIERHDWSWPMLGILLRLTHLTLIKLSLGTSFLSYFRAYLASYHHMLHTLRQARIASSTVRRYFAYGKRQWHGSATILMMPYHKNMTTHGKPMRFPACMAMKKVAFFDCRAHTYMSLLNFFIIYTGRHCAYILRGTIGYI